MGIRPASDELRFPVYSAAERRADGFIHAIGLAAALAAIAVLLAGSAAYPASARMAVVIYGAGVLAMFVLSAGYNLVAPSRLKARLRRFDHAAIFLMIAGSYTPVAGVFIGGGLGHLLLALVWGIGLVGAGIVLFFPRRFETLTYLLYFAQGWMILIAIRTLAQSVPGHVLELILGGSLIITLGAFVHRRDDLKFGNAIWHGAVLLGAGCHYAAIIDALEPLRGGF